jgi:hypothetical protein
MAENIYYTGRRRRQSRASLDARLCPDVLTVCRLAIMIGGLIPVGGRFAQAALLPVTVAAPVARQVILIAQIHKQSQCVSRGACWRAARSML